MPLLRCLEECQNFIYNCFKVLGQQEGFLNCMDTSEIAKIGPQTRANECEECVAEEGVDEGDEEMDEYP